MALQAVQQIAPPPKVSSSGGKKGGGMFGSVAGGIAGAALAGGAAAVTGGAALPVAAAALGGAGGGMALGGMLGNAVAPAKAASAIERRAATIQGPQLIQSEQTAKLKDSILALHTQPPEIKQQHAPLLVNAYLTSLAGDNKRGAV